MTDKRKQLAHRLMAAHPSDPWRGPEWPASVGDEHIPHREFETGILWHYHGPIPATSGACSRHPWGWFPDLDDAATVGVLLDTARKVAEAPRLAVHWFDGTDDVPLFTEPGWIVDGGDGENVLAGATDYAEALVIVIEETR